MEMEVEQTHLINAQDQASQYIHYIDEAMAAPDPDEMRSHIQDALAYGQNVLDHLDEASEQCVNPDVLDLVDEATQHIALSIDEGDQALDSSDEEIEEHVSEMRRHALNASNDIMQALGMPL